MYLFTGMDTGAALGKDRDLFLVIFVFLRVVLYSNSRRNVVRQIWRETYPDYRYVGNVGVLILDTNMCSNEHRLGVCTTHFDWSSRGRY